MALFPFRNLITAKLNASFLLRRQLNLARNFLNV